MGFLRVLLFPLALLYGFAIFCRNLLFDIRLLPSRKYSIPIISVGNLRTGGTGKTPHVEYLINLLDDKYNIAVLSRGYKRKTSGYAKARQGSTTAEIGDEPMQMHQKFPNILVAVHENRRKGIREILRGHPEINLIILDDAFQHRYVRPGLNLLLTGYYNPFFKDYLLPVGHLRDFKSRAKYADALIVTKTPFVFSPLDRRFFMKKLQKFKPQSVFFSKFNYQNLNPVTPLAAKMSTTEVKTIFLLSGIANTIALEEYLKTCCTDFFAHKYPDHHQFTMKDLEKLRYHFDKTISYSKIIVTTEKDAMRLFEPEIRDYIADLPVFTLPVEVAFHGTDKQGFDTMVHRFLASYAE